MSQSEGLELGFATLWAFFDEYHPTLLVWVPSEISSSVDLVRVRMAVRLENFDIRSSCLAGRARTLNPQIIPVIRPDIRASMPYDTPVNSE